MSQLALDLIAENIRTKNPVLDLGNCGLTELYPELLDELAKTGEWLEELIWSNKWFDWEAREWKYSLNKGNKNRLYQLPPALPPFPKLHILIVSELNISDCAPLAALLQLNTLDISHNQITDCAPLAALAQLNKLDISQNQITDCAPLAALAQLNTLYISQNRITDCAPLAALAQLKELSIYNNQITDCAPLAALVQLKELYIFGNQITHCPPLAALAQLNKLDIRNNQITDCAPLAALAQLHTLYISGNQITDCAPLAKLAPLHTLDISGNKIIDCAPLAKLAQLNILDISGNQINDCAPLAKLSALQLLSIYSNQITLLPFTFLDNFPELEILWLWNNPLENVDKAVYNKKYTNVLEAVKNFIKDLRQGSSAVYASKLVVVGNGRVGKTCLVKRWLDDGFDAKENSTHAVQLRRYSLDKLAQAMELESLQLNIWDFGGQDIYHATHQVFLKTNALFLLVWDAETEAQPLQTEILADGSSIIYTNHPLRYWLSYIKTLSNNSPVLLVQTKAGKTLLNPAPLPDITAADWEQFNICGSLAVESSWEEDNGFKTLEEKLRILLRQQIAQQCTQLPTSWYSVRQQIEQWQVGQRKQVPLDNFQQLCAANGLDTSSTQTLLQYLHDTGTLFYREGLFGNQLVIDQQWAIDAVYALFDRSKAFYGRFRNNGFFTGQDLQTYWQQYTEAEQELFASFMQSCKICVEINPSRHNEPEKPFAKRQFLAPQLLPPDGERIKHYAFYGGKGPCILYKSSFLHAAVIQQIIVELAFLSTQYDMWANGIIITTNEGIAAVEAHDTGKEMCVLLHPTANLRLLETLQKAIGETMQYDAGLETLVSLDGKIYVSLQELAKWPAANPQIQVGEQWVDTAPYRRFLQEPDKTVAEKENPLAHLRPVATEKAAVFFSYAWKDDEHPELELVVDKLYDSLKSDGFEVIRDKKSIGYGDLISSFMDEHAQSKHILVFLSDRYIRSSYCMYELYRAYLHCGFDDQKLYKRIYPIRLEKLNLMQTDQYMDHWLARQSELEGFIAKYGFANSKGKRDELDKVVEIYPKIDPLLSLLNDINASTPELLLEGNFAAIKQKIQERMRK